MTYHNLTVWICGAKLQLLPLTVGCVNNSHRQAVACITVDNACQPPSWRQCRYGWLWLCLHLRLRLLENNLKNVYGDWSFDISDFDSDKSLLLHTLVTQFNVPDDVSHALRPFTTGCVKLKFPSLGEMRDVAMEASSWRRSIWWRLWTYFVVNTFHN